MDTIHQGLILHSAYTYLITHYGDPSELAVVTRSLLVRSTVLILSGVSADLIPTTQTMILFNVCVFYSA